MKLLRPQQEIIKPIALIQCLFLICVLLYPNICNAIYHLYWLALPTGLYLFWKSSNPSRFENPHIAQKPDSLILWFFEIAVIQLCLLAGSNAIPALINFYSGTLDAAPIQTTFILNTWIPWLVIALLSFCFARGHFFEKKRVFFNDIYAPLWKSAGDSPIGLAANRGMQLVNGFAFVSTIIFCVLILIKWIPEFFPFFAPFQTGLAQSAISTGILFLFFWLTHKKFKKFFYQQQRRPIFLLFLMIILTTLLLLLLHAWLQYHTLFPIPVAHWMQQFPLPLGSRLLTIFWWSAWIPWLAIYFTLRARGRTLRELLFGLLVIPLLITAVNPFAYIHHLSFLFYFIALLLLCILAISRRNIYQSAIQACIDPPKSHLKMRDLASSKFWSNIYLQIIFLLGFFMVYGIKALILLAGLEVVITSVFLLSTPIVFLMKRK